MIWDTNLDPELIKWIGGQAHCLLAMDPLSASKSEKARCVLSKLTYFKPNRAEAERLCGFTIETPAQIRSALDWFAAQGIKETVLSLGAQGTALAVGQQRLLMSLDSIKSRSIPPVPVTASCRLSELPPSGRSASNGGGTGRRRCGADLERSAVRQSPAKTRDLGSLAGAAALPMAGSDTDLTFSFKNSGVLRLRNPQSR
ncbi:MAG: PfkB family carbohydrate kinase [Holdemania massiliensis]